MIDKGPGRLIVQGGVEGLHRIRGGRFLGGSR